MNTYLKAGVLTLFVFLMGIMVGIWIDNYRLSSIRSSISETDINWNDARLLERYFEKFGQNSCNLALEQNLAYNKKIYTEGKEIEKKIEANIFTPDVEQEWRRYILLQTQFWLNSIELKERCNFNYSNVVYLFRQKELDRDEAINNRVQSSVLSNLKEECGNKIMLIPITTDLNLIVVDSVVKKYNITEFPATIVDENYVFQGVTKRDTLEKLLNCSTI